LGNYTLSDSNYFVLFSILLGGSFNTPDCLCFKTGNKISCDLIDTHVLLVGFDEGSGVSGEDRALSIDVSGLNGLDRVDNFRYFSEIYYFCLECFSIDNDSDP
jgi:hypothetical protein